MCIREPLLCRKSFLHLAVCQHGNCSTYEIFRMEQGNFFGRCRDFLGMVLPGTSIYRMHCSSNRPAYFIQRCNRAACIPRMQFKGLGVPQQAFCNAKVFLYRRKHCLQMQTLYIRLPCLRALWNLSTRLPNLKIILQSRPSIFKFHLMWAVIFCSGSFRVCNRSKQGELVPTHDFWIWFYKSDFKNDCWASPKPDIQHKIAPTAYLSRRWTSKFLQKKFVLWKFALIHSILHQTGTITSGFEGKKRKYHFLKIWVLLWYALSRAVHKNRTSQVRFSPSKPDLIRPKNACMIVICFLQLLIGPWKPHDRLHGIPGEETLWGRAGKRRWKGAGNPCRENGTQNLKSRWYAKPEPAVPILPWNSLHIF